MFAFREAAYYSNNSRQFKHIPAPSAHRLKDHKTNLVILLSSSRHFWLL